MKKIKVFKFSNPINYRYAWQCQKVLNENLNVLRKENMNNLAGYLILLEHSSVYTIGKGGDNKNILSQANETSNIYRIERGGDITWHGPGQITMYPILDLYQFKKDLHWYLRSLEEAVIVCLNNFGIDGKRLDVNTGVWIDNNKVSAIGVTASRWITMHGSSLNVTCDLTPFSHIIPCGITDNIYGITTLQKELNERKMYRNIKSNELVNLAYQQYVDSFSTVFGVEMIDSSLDELEYITNLYPSISESQLIPLKQ